MFLDDRHPYEELDPTVIQHEPMSTKGGETTDIYNFRTITKNKGNLKNK